ncbi:class II aaRS and biotin synthetase [Ceraceosorus guamensis]|uniref:proline--tRNA ligase n=1 Tax=Ceraceosorus guamensis TaxID=1522189 RepID=A0A316W9V4_9BASI|nr:class II aaRS and biotin synthetase [Ceraceosorus guamensis]PWN44783.1 class II aaRS and biotin synthetase [Ceraceosorus guamensis]
MRISNPNIVAPWGGQGRPILSTSPAWSSRQRSRSLDWICYSVSHKRCCQHCCAVSASTSGIPLPVGVAATHALSRARALNLPSKRHLSTATTSAQIAARARLENNTKVTFLSRLFVPTLKADNVGSNGTKGGSKSKEKDIRAPKSIEASPQDAALGGSSDLDAAMTLLLRGGYVRQSSSGIYSLLTPGQRVQNKISRVVVEEMERGLAAPETTGEGVGASRIQLPTLLPSTNWEKSRRWESMGSDMYKLRDRHGRQWLLAPTAEEEVTALVGDSVKSERDLPVRVYQISRKHRDEPRPRLGLIRTREFLMKDMYTFDKDLSTAAHTYQTVRRAYTRTFDRLLGKGSWKSVAADTGSMGGRESHEYHVEDRAGEDTLLTCNDASCAYSANSELADALPAYARGNLPPTSADDVQVVYFSLRDNDHVHSTSSRSRSSLTTDAMTPESTGPGGSAYTLAAVVLPKSHTVNSSKLHRHLAPNAITLEQVASSWNWETKPQGPLLDHDKLAVWVDRSCGALEPEEFVDAIRLSLGPFAAPPGAGAFDISLERLTQLFPTESTGPHAAAPAFASTLSITHADLLQAEEGDTCSSCRRGSLRASRAVEIGHAFLLGTKYSDALEVGFVPSGDAGSGTLQPFQMGCYGIGITRLLGILAARALTHGRRGGREIFAWPGHLAPYSVGIILVDPSSQSAWNGVSALVDLLSRERGRDEHESGLEKADETSHPPLLSGVGELIGGDVAIDDRPATRARMGARLAEADLMGYPWTFIFGKRFAKAGEIEVRHRGDVHGTGATAEGWQGFVKLQDLLAKGHLAR